MAPAACPLFVFLCVLSLSTLRSAVASKLERTHGAGSSILQDALRDMEEKDMAILGAEDVPELLSEDAEAMRERLLTIDAERALLHRRLGLGHGPASDETKPDGMREVFEHLARDLAPLVGLQMAQEVVVLVLAGILVYYATKWRILPPKQPKEPAARSHTRPSSTSSGSAAGPNQGSAVGRRARTPLDIGVASSQGSSDYVPPKVVSTAPWRISQEPRASAERETSPLRPPPGLELDRTEDLAVASPLELHEGGCEYAEIDGASNFTGDPGLPPGLNVQLSGNSDGLEVKALSTAETVIQELQDQEAMPELVEACEIPDETLVVSSQEQEQLPEVVAMPEPMAASKIPDDTFVVSSQKQEQSDAHSETLGQVSAHDTEARATKRKKSTKGISEAKLSSDTGVAAKAVVDSKDMHSCWRVPLWQYLPRFFHEQTSSEDDEFSCAIDDLTINKKKAPGSTQNYEKVGKRKAKQQQRLSTQKLSEDASCKKPGRSWGLRWPCSLPLTAALTVMLCIVLAGRIVDWDSFETAEKHKELAEKKEQLAQLKRRHNSYSFRLALLQLDEFQEEAAGVLASLPSGQGSKLQSAKQDAGDLRESLRDIADEEFPQVEESIKNVYSHWVQTLADAKRLASSDGQCERSSCSQPA